MLNVKCPILAVAPSPKINIFTQCISSFGTCKNVINLIINFFACLNLIFASLSFTNYFFWNSVPKPVLKSVSFQWWKSRKRIYIYILPFVGIIYILYYILLNTYTFAPWSFLWRLCGVVLLYIFIYIFCVSVHFVDF